MISKTPQTLREFYNDVMAPNFQPGTQAAHVWRVAIFERFLGRAALLSDLNADAYQGFSDWLDASDHYATTTARHMKAMIRAVWFSAHQHGVAEAPMPFVLSKSGRPRRERPKPREPEQPAAAVPTEPLPSNWAAIRFAMALQSTIAAAFGYGPDRKLGTFLAKYISTRTDIRDTTRALLIRAQNDLNEFFGADRQIGSITSGEADEFRRRMMSVLGENTARRLCGRAKQFFTAAVRCELLDKSPFADMRGVGVRGNPARAFFVTRELAARVLAACPTPAWRLIFALARFGGLRCPSEHMALNWTDVDWEKSRLRVPSSKTAYCGKPFRIIPLFPELRPHLLESFDLAGRPKDGLILPDYRRARRRPRLPGSIEPFRPGLNMRSSFNDFMRKAGIPVWQKPFQNCRATRETELANDFPIHVVCAWLGNTEAVAKQHYLQMTDDYFDRAVCQNGGAA